MTNDEARKKPKGRSSNTLAQGFVIPALVFLRASEFVPRHFLIHGHARAGRVHAVERKEKAQPVVSNELSRDYWQRPTLAQPIDALPSGLQRFTSVFGMGTGGATALGSPEF